MRRSRKRTREKTRGRSRREPSCESDLAEFPSRLLIPRQQRRVVVVVAPRAGISLPLHPFAPPIVFRALLPFCPSRPPSYSPSPLSLVSVSSPFHLFRQQPYALRFARGSDPSVTPVDPRRFAVGAIWPLLHAGYITAALLNYARYFSFRWERKGGARAFARLPSRSEDARR